jgi:hypothetical protein
VGVTNLDCSDCGGEGLSFGHWALELKIVGNVGFLPLKVDEENRTIAEVTKTKRFIPGKDVSSSSLAKLRNCKLAGESTYFHQPTVLAHRVANSYYEHMSITMPISMGKLGPRCFCDDIVHL